MTNDFQVVLICIPLSANTVLRYFEEIVSDVDKTLTLELQHYKFASELDGSTFGGSNILIAYVRFHSS